MSAFDILTDLIEDPQDNGNYRLLATGSELRELWKATESEKDQLTQWRDVAGKLAEALKEIGDNCLDCGGRARFALNFYDTLAKLSEKCSDPNVPTSNVLTSLSDGGKG